MVGSCSVGCAKSYSQDNDIAWKHTSNLPHKHCRQMLSNAGGAEQTSSSLCMREEAVSVGPKKPEKMLYQDS